MNTQTQQWSTLQLALLLAIAISPFWFMAANVRDGDEFAKTGMGVGIAAVVASVLRRGHA